MGLSGPLTPGGKCEPCCKQELHTADPVWSVYFAGPRLPKVTETVGTLGTEGQSMAFFTDPNETMSFIQLTSSRLVSGVAKPSDGGRTYPDSPILSICTNLVNTRKENCGGEANRSIGIPAAFAGIGLEILVERLFF